MENEDPSDSRRATRSRAPIEKEDDTLVDTEGNILGTDCDIVATFPMEKRHLRKGREVLNPSLLRTQTGNQKTIPPPDLRVRESGDVDKGSGNSHKEKGLNPDVHGCSIGEIYSVDFSCISRVLDE